MSMGRFNSSFAAIPSVQSRPMPSRGHDVAARAHAVKRFPYYGTAVIEINIFIEPSDKFYRHPIFPLSRFLTQPPGTGFPTATPSSLSRGAAPAA